ncbi:MAG TPA: VIT domain-containing protein [Burkholderiales bacterium]|nr:VIT domain-containing protein [Burkholderiales bacterium]
MKTIYITAMTLLAILFAPPAYTRSPAPRLVVPHAESPIVLQKLQIDAEISGGIARTTVQMTFHNPNRRQLEGELQFPLLDRQQVTGFALDIDGKLRDAVVVEKARGRQVFEDITRQRIDPGLLQVTAGNNFKLRVYPIFGNRSRTVAVTYVENLGTRGTHSVYRLPLEYGERIEAFSMRLRVVGAGPRTRISAGPIRDAEIWTSGSMREVRLERRNFEAKGTLELEIDHGRGPRMLTQQVGGEHYFYAQVPVGVRTAKRALPPTIGIIWDSSGSGLARDHARELAVLDAYFAAARNADVQLVRIRDTAEPPASFRVTNADWSALKAALQATVYDGATNLGAFKADAAVKEYLLFSDGLSNYGEAAFAPPAVPVHTLSAAPQSNPAWLRSVADRSGGRYFDLTAQTAADAAAGLIAQAERMASITSRGARDLMALSPHPVDGMLTITGILVQPDADIRVELAGPGRRSRSIGFRVRQDTADGAFAGAFWARERIARLEAEYDANRGEILKLGRQFGLVTRETSLIVLETVFDYVRFDIEPPTELLADYQRVRAAQRRPQPFDPKQKVEQVVSMLDARAAWWQRDFPKGPLPSVAHAPRAAAGAVAPPAELRKDAYLTDSQGQVVRSTIAGVCVRSGQWSPALALAECDGDFVPKPRPKPAAKPMVRPKPAKPMMARPRSGAVAGMPAAVWRANAPYRARLREADAAEVYRLYLAERESYHAVPAFYIDVADILLSKGLRALALRVLSNLAEIDLEDRHALRSLAARLTQLDEAPLAVAIYRRVARLAPDEPQSLRDLGLALAALGEAQQAIDALYEVVTRQWHARFPEIELIALADLNAIVATSSTGLDLSRIDPRLLRNMPVDLRIVLTWDADNTNLDLLVTDPNGHTLMPGSGVSYQGGRLSRNLMQGYGPEEYAVREAKPGTYRVVARYSGQTRQTVGAAPVYAHVHVYTKFASGAQTVRTHNVQFDRPYTSSTVTEVTIPGAPDEN